MRLLRSEAEATLRNFGFLAGLLTKNFTNKEPRQEAAELGGAHDQLRSLLLLAERIFTRGIPAERYGEIFRFKKAEDESMTFHY
jgi:hypothetical protein